ncbi:hypothetical protein NDU88_002974 [Pleurodeles waltl]|uniref:Uncharacterized protein n=1 Tax=Pleurodeles waltl TaxID=8319 RepID=A0AAV7VFC6_PLEWA|nr:hypothetical protein NDU88_002974 [Pleurodeles waltl]
MFVRSLKQPVRSGIYGMRGCVRGSSPSTPAVLGLLRTCAQGAATAIVGLLRSSLARVCISLPSGPWANRCVVAIIPLRIIAAVAYVWLDAECCAESCGFT